MKKGLNDLRYLARRASKIWHPVTVLRQNVQRFDYDDCLSIDVIKWLIANCVGGYAVAWQDDVAIVDFRNKESALLFKLTWGGQ